MPTPEATKPKPDIGRRSFDIRAASVDVQQRTIELAFSSTEPYTRWWGVEILDHKAESVRMGRVTNRAPLLLDHSMSKQIGVIESASIDADGVGRAVVRFSKSALGEEILQDVQDGIRCKVSVGYQVHAYQLESKNGDEETYRITDWEPFEISIVSVPADDTVGVGRSADEFAPNPPAASQRETDETAEAIPAPADTKPEQEVRQMTVAVTDNDVLTQERARVKEINSYSERFGVQDMAQRAINEGTTVDQFRIQVLDEMSRRPNSGVVRASASDRDVGLTNSEVEQFSFRKLVLALADPTCAGDAGFELEACRAAAQKRGSIARGKGASASIPAEVVMRSVLRPFMKRDLTVGAPTGGGYTVATDLMPGSFIDMLINRLALTQLGVTRLTGLSGNIAIPRQTGGAACYWVAENGAPTESQATFDQVAMTPKTIAGYTEVSRLLLKQSSLDIEAFMQTDLQRSMALGTDSAAINGSGASNQPRGVRNTSGIGSVVGGTDGLAPTWDHMVDLESAVANVNADVNALKYLTNTKVRGKLKKTQKFSGTSGESVWDAISADTVLSNQVPSDLVKGTSGSVCSAILYGNWADLILAFWGEMDILVDPYSNSTTGAVRVTAFQSLDTAVRHPESFSAMVDAKTT